MMQIAAIYKRGEELSFQGMMLIVSINAFGKDEYGLSLPGRKKLFAFIVALPFYMMQVIEVVILNIIQMPVNKKRTENEKRRSVNNQIGSNFYL
jgi:hypothetical protein